MPNKGTYAKTAPLYVRVPVIVHNEVHRLAKETGLTLTQVVQAIMWRGLTGSAVNPTDAGVIIERLVCEAIAAGKSLDTEMFPPAEERPA